MLATVKEQADGRLRGRRGIPWPNRHLSARHEKAATAADGVILDLEDAANGAGAALM
ncbi:MAG: hypothetical protein ABIS08_09355 [Pseudolysinimonas sp.]